MLRMIVRLRFLLFCLMTLHFTNGVDLDYYYGGLRSEKTCNNITEKIDCQIKCGADTGMCIENICYCLSVAALTEYNIKDFRDLNVAVSQGSEDDHYIDVHDDRDYSDYGYEGLEYLDESLLYNKPVLRHHIAHFCPNLDIARSCIRTCMKEGKPAFCGKDHVCYCGHRYSNKDRNPDGKSSGVYEQFKDLYEKYFGPNYKQEIEV